MSFTAKTAFQPRMWNNRHNDLQNVAGEFGAMVSETWTPADCSAGMFCVKGDHLPHGGYKMTVAANGTGDIYICNPGDVQRGVIRSASVWGDFFSTLSAEAITGALTGCRYDRASVLAALRAGGIDGAVYRISAEDMAGLLAD